MKVSSAVIGEDRPGQYPKTHQLLTTITIGLPASTRFRVVFRSASRNDTSYEIFDQFDKSMGVRRLTYAIAWNPMHIPLVDDLNILMDEFGIVLNYDAMKEIVKDAVRTCEARYGRGIEEGDAIIIFY